jgi:hypothetical protein
MKSLVDGYRFMLEHKLKESDLVTRLALMSKEEVNSVMCSSKLLSLCILNGICTKEQGLKGIEPSQLGVPYTALGYQVTLIFAGPLSHSINKDIPFLLQPMCGSDSFRLCNPEGLKPDYPPALEKATLPGTNRR